MVNNDPPRSTWGEWILSGFLLSLVSQRVSESRALGLRWWWQYWQWGRHNISHGSFLLRPVESDRVTLPFFPERRKKEEAITWLLLYQWSQQDSNLWPHRCERCALPTEPCDLRVFSWLNWTVCPTNWAMRPYSFQLAKLDNVSYQLSHATLEFSVG